MLRSELLERNSRLERWHAQHPHTSTSQSGSSKVWTRSLEPLFPTLLKSGRPLDSKWLYSTQGSILFCLHCMPVTSCLCFPISTYRRLKSRMAHALPLMQQGSLRQALSSVQAPRDTFNRANAGASGGSGKASTSHPVPTTEVAPPHLSSHGRDCSSDERHGCILLPH